MLSHKLLKGFVFVLFLGRHMFLVSSFYLVVCPLRQNQLSVNTYKTLFNATSIAVSLFLSNSGSFLCTLWIIVDLLR